MAAMYCPHCQASLQAPREGQEFACPECGGTIRVWSTQIQTPELRIDSPPSEAPGLPVARDSIKEPTTALPFANLSLNTNSLATSGAFRREMERFSEKNLPALDHVELLPLPEQVPVEADRLGKPLASVRLKGDNRIFGTLAGALFLAFGLFCLVGPLIAIANEGLPKKKGDGAGILLPPCVYFPLASALGGWLIFLRKWTPPRSLWVCPHGLIWEWGPRSGFRRWEQIEEFSASGATGRPLFWITPALGTDFVLSAGQDPAVVPIADYIELKCSAVLLPVLFRRLQAGERVSFGELAMDRAGIRARGQACQWSEIGGTRLDGTAFLVTDRYRRERVRLRTRDVSFPMVAQAIIRTVSEEGLPA
jgi:hypothetical protein